MSLVQDIKKRVRIKHRILMPTLALSLVMVLTIVTITVVQKQTLQKKTSKELNKASQTEVEVVAYNDGYSSAKVEFSRALNTMIVWITGTIIGIAVLSGMVSWLVARNLSMHVKKLTDAFTAMGEGDFVMDIDIDSSDEVGQMARVLKDVSLSLQKKASLADSISKGDLTVSVDVISEKDILGKALEKMTWNLREFIGKINSSMVEVAAGASQVSDTSQVMAQGATEQAASLQEISSALTEITYKTKENAENAKSATQLTREARDRAEDGGQKMIDMVNAMQDVANSSREVAKVIKVIDDIAFQTNLLALNAAVEAARAGKYGKGFTVVAEEVRNLAGRSAKAASETAELVENSLKNAENGSALALRSVEGFTGIVDGTKRAAELVGEIAGVSNEQAQGLSEITAALSQIDQSAQHNTASSEDLASTSEELSGQSSRVSSLLRTFRLGEAEGQSALSESRLSAEETSAPAQVSDDSWGQLVAPSQDPDTMNGSWGDEAEIMALQDSVMELDDSGYGRF